MTLVKMSQVSKFFGKIQALKDINLVIDPGCTGVIGPNGAGKTTLFNIILGFIKPTTGDVEVFGRNPWREYIYIRRNIGALIEDMYLNPFLTGREFLSVRSRMLGLDNGESIIESLSREINLDWALDQKISTYSQGMLKRLGLISTLLNPKVKLLILDEPFSNIDVESAVNILRLLSRLKEEGISIILSSHIPTYLDYICDKYVVLNGGRIVRISDSVDILYEIGSLSYIVKSSDPDRLIEFLEGNEGIKAVKLSRNNVRVDIADKSDILRILYNASVEMDIKIYEVRLLEDVYSRLWS